MHSLGNETPKRAMWSEKLHYPSPADWLLCHPSCADFRAEPWLLEAAFPQLGIHTVDVYSWVLPRLCFLSSTAQLCVCVSSWGGSAGRSDGVQSAAVCAEATSGTCMGQTAGCTAWCTDTKALGHTDTALLRTGGSWSFLSILTCKFFHTERSQCAYSCNKHEIILRTVFCLLVSYIHRQGPP